MSARQRSAASALAVAWRTLHNFFTNPALLAAVADLPAVLLHRVRGRAVAREPTCPGFDFPAGYTAFQFVFVLLQSAAFGGVFTGFAVARDFESRFARRLMLAAPNRRALIAGYAMAAAVRAAVTLGRCITVVALLAGMQVGGGARRPLRPLRRWRCSSTSRRRCSRSGIAMRFRTLQAGPLMQMPVFLILFLAPVYVPLDLLSGWIHAVAVAQPGHGAAPGRARLHLRASPTACCSASPARSGLVAAFGVWAVRGLRSAERAG